MANRFMRLIDYLFYHEDDIREGIAEYKKGEFSSHRIYQCGGARRFDPTGNRAVRNLSPVDCLDFEDGSNIPLPENILRIIKETYNETDPLTSRIARDKYKFQTQESICAKYRISIKVYYRRMQTFRNVAFQKLVLDQDLKKKYKIFF